MRGLLREIGFRNGRKHSGSSKPQLPSRDVARGGDLASSSTARRFHLPQCPLARGWRHESARDARRGGRRAAFPCSTHRRPTRCSAASAQVDVVLTVIAVAIDVRGKGIARGSQADSGANRSVGVEGTAVLFRVRCRAACCSKVMRKHRHIVNPTRIGCSRGVLVRRYK